MAATVNERIRDATLRHAIRIQRYVSGLLYRLSAMLMRSEAAMAADLAAKLETMPPESFSVQRLEQLLSSVRQLNTDLFVRIRRMLGDEMVKVGANEIQFQAAMFETAIPDRVLATVKLAVVSPEQVAAAAMSRPFQGTLLNEALDGIEAGRARAIREQVRLGYVANETVSQIVTRLRGTRAQRYEDGLLSGSRRQVEAIARTAVSHTANYAQDQYIAANADYVKGVKWLSTLDGRTTPQCRLRDGLEYTLEHKPIGHKYPWGAGPGRLHWNCRSTSTPILKSWEELGLSLPDLPVGTRSALNGQVPATLRYGDWLRTQSADFQDEVLGATRGALFRRGGLDLDRFATERGRWMTLEELREREQAAFRKAGL